jgi:hypothetical protein
MGNGMGWRNGSEAIDEAPSRSPAGGGWELVMVAVDVGFSKKKKITEKEARTPAGSCQPAVAEGSTMHMQHTKEEFASTSLP